MKSYFVSNLVLVYQLFITIVYLGFFCEPLLFFSERGNNRVLPLDAR